MLLIYLLRSSIITITITMMLMMLMMMMLLMMMMMMITLTTQVTGVLISNKYLDLALESKDL